jgi:hypothetical protein
VAGEPPTAALDPDLLTRPFDTPSAASAAAGEVGGFTGSDASKTPQDPPDLSLRNLFTVGWDEEFTRRPSEGRAPDLSLLKVQTNFMVREFLLNYAFTSDIHSKTQRNLHNLDFLLAYSFNRRFMLQVTGNYQWLEGRTGPDLSGASAQLVGRVQLVSTAASSYSFNFRVVTPDTGLGQHQTTLSYGLAGFEDLTERLGLYRVGLYYSFLFDSLAGPRSPGARQNDVAYDVTVAKTLTRPDTPVIGNLTVFLEGFAQTDLDGVASGRTLASVTPGVRFNLGKVPGIKLGLDNWIIWGAEIPVAGPKPWDTTYRLNYIKNF